MKRCIIPVFVLALLWCGVTDAALVAKGFGTIVGGTGEKYQLIYDTELDVTWLDFSTGLLDWHDATTWAAQLEVSVGGQAYDGWRLPQTLPVDGSTYDYSWENDGSADRGYNISAPKSAHPGSKGSEMAYMYYNNLGNKGYYDVNGNVQPGWDVVNTDPFDNLLADYYWSETVYGADPTGAWNFRFYHGYQHKATKSDDWYSRALAVHTGDVSVPEPATILLFGSSLVGLLRLRKRATR